MQPDMSSVKNIHLIGIGGCGMSAIAKVLIKMGYKISGSDSKESINTMRMKEMGATVYIGHDKANVRGADLTVVSSAIPKTNPEISASVESGIPIEKRAEMLSWIMDQYKTRIAVAGTHGKTTTTSMISSMLTKCDLDPTSLVGGEANDVDGNARIGKSQYVVAEADESDGSFLVLHPTIAIISNIECDHMEYYGTFGKVVDTFVDFAKLVPESGIVIMGGHDKGIEEAKKKISLKNVITYGFDKDLDYYADNFRFSERRSKFDVHHKRKLLGEISLSVPGQQNIENALAAIAVGVHLGCEFSCIASGLQVFTGAKRRFQIIGERADIMVIDDYGHHPTEVIKTLEAARLGYPGHRLICVFQPHRYTRTMHLCEEFGTAFKNADKTIITEIYSAGEQPIQGISGKTVYEEIKKSGSDVTFLKKKEKVVEYLIENAKPGDIILVMGAGDINTITKEILNRLKENA